MGAANCGTGERADTTRRHYKRGYRAGSSVR